MEAQHDSETVSVSFSILNRSFRLTCSKEHEAALAQAVEHVKKEAAELLSSNPTWGPLDAAILSAVYSEHRLLRYQTHKRPFIIRAERLIAEIERNAGKLIDD